MPNPIDLCTLADVRSQLQSQPAPIRKVVVTNGGSGYGSVPAVTSVNGDGSGATFTAQISGGTVVAVLVTNGGINYTIPPDLIFGGPGSGAIAQAYVGDDFALTQLITRASRMFLSITSRPGFAAVVLNERRNGNGQLTMPVRYWPVLSVQSIIVAGITIPTSSDGIQSGWMNDQYNIYLINTLSGLRGLSGFTQGIQNIMLNYTSGWASIPEDVTQAVAELVAQKYLRRSHQDVESKTIGLGGESIKFNTKDVPSEVLRMLDNYVIRGFIE